ncbi:class I SAM-dependent methyltransferase [Vacuolonema iberomarrocanum]|uniref:class I SAM-dependent methyltransferase n=1 Tax=Vacuolonema iberomarrocanum TaxID=3454632 RepID=UPI0019F8ED22|nr:class I SAM-dependent methyltransferase [filamentous cyanobacterium LEGE 07170]
MATIFRDLSYRYQWFYDGISRMAAIAVGGESRFRTLALQGLDITPATAILDLCCGSGQTTSFLVNQCQDVTGLDASPRSIQRAQNNVPQAKFVEGWAEAMPFSDAQFDVVHTSVALHEMKPEQLRQILQEVHRVLKPGGIFALIDFHAPTNPLLMPGLAMFFWLFETETAWHLIQINLPEWLQDAGFATVYCNLHAGGSLQTLQAHKDQLS